MDWKASLVIGPIEKAPIKLEESGIFGDHQTILVSAIGDFSSDSILTRATNKVELTLSDQSRSYILKFAKRNHRRWVEIGFEPMSYSITDNGQMDEDLARIYRLSGACISLAYSVHGVRNNQEKIDSLYILFSINKLGAGSSYALLGQKISQLEMLESRARLLRSEIEIQTNDHQLEGIKLTARELDILCFLRIGKTNIEIGLILDISPNTVKNHLKSVFKKMNVVNRAQAAYLSRL
ncbi:hypothetical protein G6653_08625 [Polynucleobacter paneuropaeus]|jgi:DNA-binding CsgD family transcriptional regulator|nr:hypothetical protein [Polynucleobacter paneuropaeus]MBT8612026.1 hypothetical protein [Polynucleobacter paneuropaeus]